MTEYSLRSLRSCARWCLLVALFALPFEPVFGFALGSLTLTPIEMLIAAAVGLWVLLLLWERRRPIFPRSLLIPGGLLLVVLLAAAALASAERSGALKVALRQVQGAALALCLADWLRQTPEMMSRRVALALLSGAALSAAIGLWEMSEQPAALAATAIFKDAGSYMGGLLRLSGTFSYANTAAMYFEALLPLAVLVAVLPGQRLLAGATALLLVPAIIFTYSRAALVVMLLLLLVTPLLAGWYGGRVLVRRTAWLSGGLLGLLALMMLSQPIIRLRLIEPDVARWYGAGYAAEPIGPMAPNELRQVTVYLENSGQIPWDPGGTRPVRLSYHWLDAETQQVVQFEGRRTVLSQVVMPGSTIAISATLQAPSQPGRYVLAWDMLREYIGRGWFSQMGIAPLEVPVLVQGTALPQPAGSVSDPPNVPQVIAAQPGPPGRRVLWTTAIQLWLERPWLGIGPDVFRHVYGPRLGMTLWDNRVHTNNLYLEVLVGAGPAALGAFLLLCATALLRAWRTRVETTTQQMLLGGALLGLAAFLMHGLLDVFLSFTPTYGLFWVMIGIIGGMARDGMGRDGTQHAAS